MIKYDYIEEIGQHYYQCVIEIHNMNLIDYSFFYSLWDFYNIVHTEVNCSNPVKEMKVYGTATKHVFKYSMS